MTDTELLHEVEQAMLGAMITRPRRAGGLPGPVVPELFTDGRHQAIAAALTGTAGEERGLLGRLLSLAEHLLRLLLARGVEPAPGDHGRDQVLGPGGLAIGSIKIIGELDHGLADVTAYRGDLRRLSGSSRPVRGERISRVATPVRRNQRSGLPRQVLGDHVQAGLDAQQRLALAADRFWITELGRGGSPVPGWPLHRFPHLGEASRHLAQSVLVGLEGFAEVRQRVRRLAHETVDHAVQRVIAGVGVLAHRHDLSQPGYYRRLATERARRAVQRLHRPGDLSATASHVISRVFPGPMPETHHRPGAPVLPHQT